LHQCTDHALIQAACAAIVNIFDASVGTELSVLQPVLGWLSCCRSAPPDHARYQSSIESPQLPRRRKLKRRCTLRAEAFWVVGLWTTTAFSIRRLEGSRWRLRGTRERRDGKNPVSGPRSFLPARSRGCGELRRPVPDVSHYRQQSVLYAGRRPLPTHPYRQRGGTSPTCRIRGQVVSLSHDGQVSKIAMTPPKLLRQSSPTAPKATPGLR